MTDDSAGSDQSTELTPEDIAALGSDVGVLVPLVKTLSDRWKWAKIAAAVCLVFGLTGVGFGIKGTRDAADARGAAAAAQRSADAIIANRTGSRIVNCKDANTFGGFHNALLDAVEGIIRAVGEPRPERTPEQQAAAEKFVADNIAALEKTRVVIRDCSAEAVNAYYDRSD